MATFAQPTPDENLVPGWDVQANTNLGFAQAAVIGGYEATQGQVSAGGNSMAGGVAPYQTDVLVNGSYSVTPTTALGQSVVWTTQIPASTVFKAQPFGTNASMTIAGGTLTSVNYTAFGSTTSVQLGTAAGTYNIPAGASVAVTYSVVPTSITFTSTGV